MLRRRASLGHGCERRGSEGRGTQAAAGCWLRAAGGVRGHERTRKPEQGARATQVAQALAPRLWRRGSKGAVGLHLKRIYVCTGSYLYSP
jgi:hypothetical protein